MLTALRTPGVYYESVDAGGPDVTPLRTDIAGFVGIAERGPLDLPVPVTSWRQFVSWFGDVIPSGYLAYAVRGFFENGGVRAWVVRVASKDPAAGAAAAAAELSAPAGPAWRVAASTPGAWGNRLSVNVREINRVQLSIAGPDPEGRWSTVPSLSGLARAVHVRLRQSGKPSVWKVVSDVDPVTQRVFWVYPDGQRLPYDAPLAGLDLDAPIMLESVEYRMVVSEAGRVVAIQDRLSLIPESDSYGPRVLPGTSTPVDPVTRAAAWLPLAYVSVEELRASTTDLRGLTLDPATRLPLRGGRSGLVTLAPRDFVGEPAAPGDGPVAVADKTRGLRALEDVAEIGILAVPDMLIRPEPTNPRMPPPACVPDPCRDPPPEPTAVFPSPDTDEPPIFTDQQVYTMQSELVQQCERLRNRFALLDPPFAAATDAASGLRTVLDWRSRFDTSFAALNYPWLRVLDPLDPAGATLRLVPPSGHAAGAYAGTDLQAGVHKAPANLLMQWVLAASAEIDDTRHGILNDAGVNAIRAVGNRGLRLLGARTTCSDPDWRFVNVRRLMAMIEKALEIALQWAVFEPDDVYTRARAMLSVTTFLLGLHEAGALAGATADESFYVACDDSSSPPGEHDARLLVEVGIAPAVPFEFVVVRVGRVGDSLQVRETGAAR